ncbi:hemicentin-2-like [Trematomus bernacchii]|uniref:hemicentin-2-like n=1 Tax=Trematomus bernacchii TaxID=40690 RepID=UPI00146F792B|nr:hemicentin-2-like [Trematomus bernacchii]
MKTFWFTKQKDGEPVDVTTESEYAGRVENLCENNICTLRIRNLRESDSADYKFRIETNQADGKYNGSPGVTLSVKDLSVQVERKDYSRANLKCQSSCDLPDNDYVWYKNGGNTLSGTSSLQVDFNYLDSYSCALKGYEDSLSPSVCVTGRDSNMVTYTKQSICAPKGSSVDISCMYSSNDCIKSKLWFSPERSHQGQNPSQPEDLSEDSQYAGRAQILETERGRSTLRISDLRNSDSAQYLFKFKTPSFEWRSDLPGTTLTVTERELEVQVIKSSSGTKLVCLSSCLLTGHPTFVWYKNETKIQGETSASYGEYVDSANNYSCGYDGYRSRPVYGPKLPLVLMSPSGDIIEGRSVTLTCSSDANPAANYTWYKRNQKLLIETPQLVFNSIKSSESGECYCTAENKLGRTSKSFFIDVKYPPKPPSVSVSPSAEIEEGSSVTLTCSSDANPAANYTWYKRNQTLFQGPEGRYNVTSISSEDRGNYYCKSENQYGENKSSPLSIDVQYAPKLPSVSVSPSAEIEEGSSVTLTCSSDANPAANYTWYKRNQTLFQGPEGRYNVTSISSEDRGNYYCKSENQYGENKSSPLSIDVQYAPKPPSVSVSPSAEIKEGSSVTLTCSSDANPAANYTWYKEDEDSPKASGQIFNITVVRAEHSGSYYCEAQNKMGRQSSPLLILFWAEFEYSGAWKSAATGTITVVLLAIILIAIFIWFKRNKSDGGEKPDNNAQLNMGPVHDVPSDTAQPAEEQHDLHYSSIHLPQNQEDALYSNIGRVQPHRQTEEDEDMVEYTAVKTPGLRRQEVGEDLFALYSTVNK